MNRHMHRIIFNKARGQRMAVAETGQSDHSGAPGSVSGAPPTRHLTLALSALRLGMMAAVGSLVWVMPASAQVVVDRTAPTHQQPTVATGANGVPVVNIQTPSAGGVSRNTYQQFDVNAQGLILNNSVGMTHTQLGGIVQGNPLMAGSAGARVILNEVNSPYASQLRGTIEVAGQRAQVVVANPAGITCDGCGFINANRATLTTGTAIVKDGVLTGYQVRDGVVRVEGRGMDAYPTDYTDIIARAVQVNGVLQARDLRVTTGRNEVDAEHRIVTGLPASAGNTGTAPAVAIDVAQLGGMYAGHIRLIGTEAGVGVRNAGTIAAMAGEVVLSNQGWLSNTGSIQAATTARIQAGIVDNSAGELYGHQGVKVVAATLRNGERARVWSDQQVDLQIDGVLENQGLLAAGAGLQVRSGELINRRTLSGQTEVAIQVKGTLANLGDITGSQVKLQAGAIRLSEGYPLIVSRISATGLIDLNAADIDISGAYLNANELALKATAGSVNADQSTLSARQMTIQAARLLRTDRASVSANSLLFQASDWSNVGGSVTQLGAGRGDVQVSYRLSNQGGKINSQSASLNLQAGEVHNQSGSISGADVSLSVQGDLYNGAGFIVGGQQLQVRAGSIETSAGVLRGDVLNVAATILRNGYAGKVLGSQANLQIDGLLHNEGQIDASTDLLVRSGELVNLGTLGSVGDMRLQVQGGLRHEGAATAGGDLSIQAAVLQASANSRLVAGERDGAQRPGAHLRVSAQQFLAAHGELRSTGGMELRSADTVDLSQSDIAAKELVLTATRTLRTDAAKIETGTLDVVAQDWFNVDGDIKLQGSGVWTVAGKLDNTRGLLFSWEGQDISLSTGQLSNVDGRIENHRDGGMLRVNSFLIDNTRGELVGGLFKVQTHRLTNADGVVASTSAGEGELRVDEFLDNVKGTIVFSDKGRVTASNMDNSGGLLTSAYGALTVDVSGTLLNAQRSDVTGEPGWNGFITAGTDLNLHAGFFIQLGTLQSDGDMVLKVDNILDNHNGRINSTGAASINAGLIDNQNGQINSQATLDVRAAQSVKNMAGVMSGRQGLTLTAASLNNTGGVLESKEGIVVVNVREGLNALAQDARE